MPIDTKIDGDPAAVRAISDWLRQGVEDGVGDAVQGVRRVVYDSETSWQGPAGNGFRTTLTGGADKAQYLADTVGHTAGAVADYGRELERAQRMMELIREGATQAGLTVNGFLIMEPDSTVTVPGKPWGTAATPQAMAAYNQAMGQAAEAQQRIAAYRAALADFERAAAVSKLAHDAVSNAWADLRNKWFLVATDLAGGGAEAATEVYASKLRKQADTLVGKAIKLFDTADGATPDVAEGLARLRSAADLASRAEGLNAGAGAAEARTAKLTGVKLGAALAVADAAYDIYHGKPAGQAVVSSGTSLIASMAAGAATGAVVGSFVPVPGVGTAAGALVGAGVGIFTSGAVDSLYQNPTAIGKAFGDGATAVGDTGKAIGGLTKGAWNAVF